MDVHGRGNPGRQRAIHEHQHMEARVQRIWKDLVKAEDIVDLVYNSVSS